MTVVDANNSANDRNFDYDANGNRATTEVGPYNRILSDDTYTYEYDDEGNLVYREEINDPSQRTYYTWDHRNRLVQVSHWGNDHNDLIVDYAYDAFNQLVGKRTSKPFEDGQSSTAFVHEGGQVALQFDAQFGYDPYDDLEVIDLSHRYLWGPAVDQLLADEHVWDLSSAGENETLWALSDGQGSVTDMVDDWGRLRIHRAFDSFGNILDETHYDTDELEVSGPAGQFGYLDEAFAYTGRFFDKATGLQNNLNRWYDPHTGRWMSEDPIGFDGGDANLYRAFGNSPTNFTDPWGLKFGVIGQERWCIITTGGKVYCGSTPGGLGTTVGQMAANGEQVATCIIKGHGDKTGVFDRNENPFFEIIRGRKGIGIRTGDRNATKDWGAITNPNSRVSMRGCRTSQAARDASTVLPGIISGSPWSIVGIPGTTWTIGPWENWHDGE